MTKNSLAPFLLLLTITLLTACGGGGGGNQSPQQPPATDTTPASFSFAQIDDAEILADVESGSITISGINSAAPISISGGEYAIANGAYVSSSDTINNGQSVTIRLTSSSEYETESSATLTIGGVSATFTVATRAKDITPIAFSFSDQEGVELASDIISEQVTIEGIDNDTAISIEGGEYSIDGGSYLSTPSTMSAGQTVQVRLISAATRATRAQAKLTIGNYSTSFSVTTLFEPYLADLITSDDNDIIFLIDKENNIVYQWSIAEEAYLKSLNVGIENDGEIIAPSLMTYSNQHNRLYLGYETGAVHYFDLDSQESEVEFVTLPIAVTGLAAVGNFILTETETSSWRTHSIFDVNGSMTDSQGLSYYSRQYEWSESNARVYYFSDDTVPNDLRYSVINQTSGLISGKGDTPYHGDYDIEPPITVSPSGEYVALGSGDVYRNEDLTWIGSIGSNFAAVSWLQDNSALTVNNDDGVATLRRISPPLKKTIDTQFFDGEVVGIYGSQSKITLVITKNGITTFDSYVPSEDSDKDNVLNSEDAFPLDPAASVDSDLDGYPDAWNPGNNELDSTTGLMLDAYPEDSECYLSEHGDGEYCDYSIVTPEYTSDSVVTDGSVLYLLSEDNNRIYRWSIEQRLYLEPMKVGIESGLSIISPSIIAYSETHNRLYTGYDAGEIGFNTGVLKYFELGSDDLVEKDYVTLEQPAMAIAATGDFMVIQTKRGLSSSVLILDDSGSEIWESGPTFFALNFVWSETKSRLYFYRSGFPGDIHYIGIDLQNGALTDFEESPYHGQYSFTFPLSVSVDGEKVLTGSGNYFDGDDLTYSGSIGTSIATAHWMEDGTLATMTNHTDTTTFQRRDNSLLNVVDQATFAGQSVAIFNDLSDFVIVLVNDGRMSFQYYQSSTDIDGDGVENTVDAFPEDAAASQDSDHDGYPDAWNIGYSKNDSTGNLVLDAYPVDAACFLAEHGDGTHCNYDVMVPNYSPTQVIADNDFIYLLSEENNRVYRWSLADSAYTNPFIVGIQNGDETIGPTHMVVSPSLERLYLGYSTGAIRYIDLTGSGKLVTFTNLSRAVSNLSVMGRFLRAQYKSGYEDFHYVFDENAIETDSAQYYPYQLYGNVWSEIHDKQFYIQEPPANWGDLYVNEFDPATGTISNTNLVEDDLSGKLTPMVLSEDEGQLLLGNGDIFSTESLSLIGSLGVQLTDALWFDNTIVSIQNEDSNTTITVWEKEQLSMLMRTTYAGESLHLIRNDKDLVIVQSTASGIEFINITYGDHDNDGMPAWWESLYGFSDSHANDADLDADVDGLSNLEEYELLTLPDNDDSDSDELSDFDEVNVYLTEPLISDTDGDSLSDGDEALIHLTDPNKVDTDEDTFSDSYEVFIGMTDANNASSTPPLITSMTQSFEGETIPLLWEPTAESHASWQLDTTESYDGAQSLITPNLVEDQQSAISTSLYLANGTVSFRAKVELHYSDSLSFYVNGEYQSRIAGDTWKLYEIEVTEGMNTLEWRYNKNGDHISEYFVARIDLVTFTAN
jgi:hypothetical protein